ncbi:MAG TPA: sugar-transfer associated ATP-grasp domain-containing protein [Alphaproteobacteria bacterium]|nr:sugar-transfer associated ATP-grasp domain-containing protein [Alphaproteobacteria bacterium]
MPFTSVQASPTNTSDQALRRRLDGAPKLDLIEHMRSAIAANDKRWLTVVSEIRKLSRGPGALSAEEYFYYRLYDPALPFAAKQRFVGKAAQRRIHAACNDPAWRELAHDKLVFYARMSECGLPVPRTLATYRAAQGLAGAASLADQAELAAFLRRNTLYPCFAKPVDGMYSLGAFSIDGYDADADALVLAGGARLPIADFIGRLDGADYAGYLLQERLRPHPEIARMIGERIATARLVILFAGAEPEIFRSLWKIPVGANIADNFWRAGNMLAAIDSASGRILRVVSGVGKDHRLRDAHPDTWEPLVDRVLPLWVETTAVCRAGAAALPGIRTQSWDIAITPTGPVIVEVNFGGDLNLPQLAFGAGILDERFQAHLLACAAARSNDSSSERKSAPHRP